MAQLKRRVGVGRAGTVGASSGSVEQVADIAEFGDRLAGGLGRRPPRGLELVDPGDQVGADLLFQVLRVGRHLDAGEGFVEKAVDISAH